MENEQTEPIVQAIKYCFDAIRKSDGRYYTLDGNHEVKHCRYCKYSIGNRFEDFSQEELLEVIKTNSFNLQPLRKEMMDSSFTDSQNRMFEIIVLKMIDAGYDEQKIIRELVVKGSEVYKKFKYLIETHPNGSSLLFSV